jgi:transposase
MPRKENPVHLSEADREFLKQVVKGGKEGSRVIRRAYTLLMADEQKRDQDIADALQIVPKTVSATRKRYCEVGLPEALYEKPRPGNPRKLDGKQEAFVVALACSEPPSGHSQWTMQMLADKLIELKMVDEPISDETVRRTLKKTNSSPGRRPSGVLGES